MGDDEAGECSGFRPLERARQIDLARRMIDDLHELLALRGHEVSAIDDGDARGFEVGGVRVSFVPSFTEASPEAVVLTLEVRGDPPEGVAVLDLAQRKVHGSGGVVLESVREFCRKRGIPFEPGPGGTAAASSSSSRRSEGRPRPRFRG